MTFSQKLDDAKAKVQKWDRRYMDLVDYVKEWSEDRSTHIGAVLVKNNRVISVAYNGMPSGINDKLDSRHDRPAKYFYFEHAERNSIYSCALNGTQTAGATMYTTGIPCADCARAVLQAGLETIVVWKMGSGLEKTVQWSDSVRVGGEMLREAGVEIIEVEK